MYYQGSLSLLKNIIREALEGIFCETVTLQGTDKQLHNQTISVPLHPFENYSKTAGVIKLSKVPIHKSILPLTKYRFIKVLTKRTLLNYSRNSI